MENSQKSGARKKYKTKTQRLTQELQERKQQIEVLEKKLGEYIALGKDIYRKSPEYLRANEMIDFLETVNKFNQITIELTERKYNKLLAQYNKMETDMKQFLKNDKDLDYFIGCFNPLPHDRQMDELEASNIDLQSKVNSLTALLDARNEYISKLQEQFVASQKELNEIREAQNQAEVQEKVTISENAQPTLLSIQSQAENIMKMIDAEKKDRKKKVGRPNLYTDEKIQLICELKNRGCSIRKISEIVGCSVGTVHRILKQSQ